MLVISKSGSELAYVIPAKAGTLSNGIDKIVHLQSREAETGMLSSLKSMDVLFNSKTAEQTQTKTFKPRCSICSWLRYKCQSLSSVSLLLFPKCLPFPSHHNND